MVRNWGPLLSGREISGQSNSPSIGLFPFNWGSFNTFLFGTLNRGFSETKPFLSEPHFLATHGLFGHIIFLGLTHVNKIFPGA